MQLPICTSMLTVYILQFAQTASTVSHGATTCLACLRFQGLEGFGFEVLGLTVWVGEEFLLERFR